MAVDGKQGGEKQSVVQLVVAAAIGAAVTGIVGAAGSALSNGWVVKQMGGATRAELEAVRKSVGDMQPESELDIGAIASELVRTHGDILRAGPVTISLPTGIVVASLKRCRDLGQEWATYENASGRFIIGVGAATDNRSETVRFSFKQAGGTYKHTLTEAQMPRHRHEFPGQVWMSDNGAPDIAIGSGNRPVRNPAAAPGTTEVGDGEAHENMPPYIALHFCTNEAE